MRRHATGRAGGQGRATSAPRFAVQRSLSLVMDSWRLLWSPSWREPRWRWVWGHHHPTVRSQLWPDQTLISAEPLAVLTIMFGMPTRHVVLTDAQEQLIQSLVECGRYRNASAVIREGLRLIRREADRGARQEALRAAAATGIAATEARGYRDFLNPGSIQTYLSAKSDGIVQTPKRPRSAWRSSGDAGGFAYSSPPSTTMWKPFNGPPSNSGDDKHLSVAGRSSVRSLHCPPNRLCHGSRERGEIQSGLRSLPYRPGTNAAVDISSSIVLPGERTIDILRFCTTQWTSDGTFATNRRLADPSESAERLAYQFDTHLTPNVPNFAEFWRRRRRVGGG